MSAEKEHDDTINLYMDANIWLSFYHYTKDDLSELKKLVTLVELQRVRLYLPTQTYDEYRRNRDAKFAETLKVFRDERFAESFPQLCGEYPEDTRTLRRLIQEYRKAKSSLIDKMISDFENEGFEADNVIQLLYGSARVIATSDNLLRKARTRSLLGNPPGKQNSIGDALNWESLLEAVDDKSNLYFISDDKDYRSAVDDNAFSSFLLDEWSHFKFGKVVFFRKLSDFVKKKFPDIKLSDEGRIDLYIEALGKSRSFARSRSLLRKMYKMGRFTDSQINDFFYIVASNNQVYGIIEDEDIVYCIQTIMKDRHACLSEGLQAYYRALIGEPVDKDAL